MPSGVHATEKTLQDLQRRSEALKADNERELQAVQASLESVSAELLSSRQSSLGIVQELSTAREALREAQKESADQLRAVNEEYAIAKGSLSRNAERENSLRADLTKSRQETRDAQNNYQREL